MQRATLPKPLSTCGGEQSALTAPYPLLGQSPREAAFEGSLCCSLRTRRKSEENSLPSQENRSRGEACKQRRNMGLSMIRMQCLMTKAAAVSLNAHTDYNAGF